MNRRVRFSLLMLALLVGTMPAWAQYKQSDDPRPLKRTQRTERTRVTGPAVFAGHAGRDLKALAVPSRKQGGTAIVPRMPLQAAGFGTLPHTAPRLDRFDFRLQRAENGTVRWMQGNLWEAGLGKADGTSADASPDAYVQAAHNALAAYAEALRLDDPVRELTPRATLTDDLGFVHTRFDQTYEGLPVWGRDLVVHFGATGEVYAINGTYEPTPRGVDTVPALAAAAARRLVVDDLVERGRWAPLSDDVAAWLGMEDPEPRLVIYPDRQHGLRLAYEVSVHPNLIEWYSYFVDAKSGRILHSLAQHCTLHPESHDASAPPPGFQLPEALPAPRRASFANAQGIDLNNVDQPLRVHQADDGTFLMFSDLDNIGEFNLNESVPENGGAVTISANQTELGENTQLTYVLSSDNTWTDPAAVSAHVNMSLTYDYYKQRFARNAINDLNQSLLSIVHVTQDSLGTGLDNAFWNGRVMAYGDGNQLFTPLAGSNDVAAHEMTHGVIQHTSNLVYEFQPGALNESFADVFGVMVDREDFLLGEDVMRVDRIGLRDLLEPDNPQVLAQQPAHMNQFQNLPNTEEGDNGGVHVNSGIPNRAAALVIQELGHDATEVIYYRALSMYLTRNSQFGDARAALIRAAVDLHGEGSTEAAAVAQAFDTVGILAGEDTTNPDENDVPVVAGDLSLITFVIADGTTVGVPDGSIGWVNPFTGDVGVFSDPAALVRVGSQLSTPANGTSIWFINPDFKLAVIDLSGVDASTLSQAPVSVFDDLQIEDEGDLWNASVAPDASVVALVSAYENDPFLYFSDGEEIFELELKPQTTQQGVQNDLIQYPDVVSWAPIRLRKDGSLGQMKIAFDALNGMPLGSTGSNASDYWSIYEIFFNFTDNTTRIYDLIPAQPTSLSVGNVTYSRTDPDILAFNVVETTDTGEVWDIFLADFETGDLSGLGLPDIEGGVLPDAERPTFSPDDSFIAFTSATLEGLVFYDTQEQSLSTLSFAEVGFLPTFPHWFVFQGDPPSVDTEGGVELPSAVRLHDSFPNPFTRATTLRFDVVAPALVSLDVFDVLGRRVSTLVEEDLTAGTHDVRFDAGALPPGTYLARLRVGDSVRTQKLVLVR